MNKLILLALLAPTLASAQVRASFSLDLPVIVPQLVVVQPGIQVVPDVDYEVFNADGYYWTRHEGGWYRSSSPRSGWVYMPRGVPPGLSRMPPGKYKHWKGGGRPGYVAPAVQGPRPMFRTDGRGGDRYEGRRERHDDRHERRHDDDRGGRGRGHGKHD
ncbi:MAG: hypothetical protein WCC48_19240 [Anaeromyxobacteraceae bacterium]